MQYPKPLFPGARVALICASSTVPEYRLEPSVQAVRALGFEPVIYDSCRLRNGYLAGTDAQRASDLTNAFADSSIDGIFCIRGGYGASRILPLLDFDKIMKTPKYFGGYSDVTAIHTVLQLRCSLVTYHTPMPSTELFRIDEFDEYSDRYLKRCLYGGAFGTLTNPQEMPLIILSEGTCCGRLTGGNLTLLAASLGTPYEIDTAGAVLFLEDIGELPRKIDAMLTQLRNAGKLDACSGILLGAFTDCLNTENIDSLTLSEIFEQLLPNDKPVLSNLCCGHCLPTMSLPLGAEIRVDTQTKTIEVVDQLEPG